MLSAVLSGAKRQNRLSDSAGSWVADATQAEGIFAAFGSGM